MFIGFFLRRIVTVALCGASFWAGAKADNLFAAGAPAPAANCVKASDGN